MISIDTDPHHGLPISFYKDAIFYNGNFFVDKDDIVVTSLHNRFKDPYSPLDINTLEFDVDNIESFDKPILYLNQFHTNIAHSLWDSMYPSWYGLFYFLEEYWDKDFQWMVRGYDYRRWAGGWPLDTLEQFSGSPITSDELFFNEQKKPIKIPWLVAGTNVGLGQVGIDLCVKRQLKEHEFDPVERFVNRTYQRYGIKRKTLDDPAVNNVIYVANKRPYNGIEELFDKLNKKYVDQYFFKIVNWGHYDFSSQLEIANTTRVIVDGVGTARGNNAFLPNSAIEIQTGQHSDAAHRDYICHFDYHNGTLSRYVKTVNIVEYLREEFESRSCSDLLENYIDHALKTPLNFTPINLQENLPASVRALTKRERFVDCYMAWRRSGSNNVSDLFRAIDNS